MFKSQAYTSTMVTTANALGSYFVSGRSLPIKPGVQTAQLDSQAYTIQFEVIPPTDGLGFSAYAIVSWKVNGQPIRRVMNIYQGAAITGVCEGVDVQIVDQT